MSTPLTQKGKLKQNDGWMFLYSTSTKVEVNHHSKKMCASLWMIYFCFKKKKMGNLVDTNMSPTSHARVFCWTSSSFFVLPLEHPNCGGTLSLQTGVHEPSWLVVEAPRALKNIFFKLGFHKKNQGLWGEKNNKKIGNDESTT